MFSKDCEQGRITVQSYLSWVKEWIIKKLGRFICTEIVSYLFLMVCFFDFGCKVNLPPRILFTLTIYFANIFSPLRDSKPWSYFLLNYCTFQMVESELMRLWCFFHLDKKHMCVMWVCVCVYTYLGMGSRLYFTPYLAKTVSNVNRSFAITFLLSNL